VCVCARGRAPATAASFEHTFTEAGEYHYFCLLRPNQVVGMVIVCTKKY
jgi:plastocyanin